MGPDKALRAPGFAFSAEAEAEAAEAEKAGGGTAELVAGPVLVPIPTISRTEPEAAEAEAACLEAAEAEACTGSAAGQKSTTIVHLPGRGACRGRHEPC